MAHRTVAAILILIPALVLALPAEARQRFVAPTFRSAHADPAPCGISAAETASPAKPFTQDQVQAMVRDGLGDEPGAKAIEQWGIDFAPTEDFIQGLKTAGASQVFLAALRAAKYPEPAYANLGAARAGARRQRIGDLCSSDGERT